MNELDGRAPNQDFSSHAVRVWVARETLRLTRRGEIQPEAGVLRWAVRVGSEYTGDKEP
jgi:hypothetical protein